MFFLIKIAVSAIIIGLVTEIARRFPKYGGIFAALPVVSVLSIVWLHLQETSNDELKKFIIGVLIGYPASALLLGLIYLGLNYNLNVYLSILSGIIGWIIFVIFQNHITEFIKLYLIR